MFALSAAAALAVAVAAFMVLAGYSLTAEDGTNPNRGGAGETIGRTAQLALPAVLEVLEVLEVMLVLDAGSSRSPWPSAVAWCGAAARQP